MNNSRIPTPVSIPSDIELEVDFSDEVPVAELAKEAVTFVASCGQKSVTIASDKVESLGNNSFRIPIETKDLGPGDLWLTVTLKVNDPKFSDSTKDIVLREFTNIKLV